MCVLKVYSKKKSFGAFAVNCSIPVYSVKEAGEVRRKSTGELYQEYRISFDVSGRDWDEFPGQVEDAIAFLDKHQKELVELLSTHPISEAYLDFPLWSRLYENIVNQNDHLPSRLVVACGGLGLGIEMALYSRDAFEDNESPTDALGGELAED